MEPGDSTFVSMTYNLWGDAHSAQREPALRAFLAIRQPDLLATQELRPWSRDVVDDVLPGHDRVEDDFRGWSVESNLWWRRSLFTHIEHGARDVGILDEFARLFWVRLRAIRPETELVLATAHLTWPGHRDERADGVGRREPQAQRIAAELRELAGSVPCIFTADLNDIGPANWALGTSGFLDSFSALGQHSPVTHPVIPIPFSTEVGTRLSPLASPAKAIDWLFHRGDLMVRSSEVADYFHHGSAPSDHKAVLATYTFAANHEPTRPGRPNDTTTERASRATTADPAGTAYLP
jgi:endonuclease/exonuclease/phosphatase family metal-dependent hydrolase